MSYHGHDYYYITPKGDGNNATSHASSKSSPNYYYITPKGDGNC